MAKITGSSDQNRQLFLRVAVLEAEIGGIHLLETGISVENYVEDNRTHLFFWNRYKYSPQ